jgi:membrane protease YdiL (CAAX protease family)
VAWSVSFMVIGYVLSRTAGSTLFAVAASRFPLVMDGPTAGLLIQSAGGIAVYGALTWVVGRRALRLSFAELGFASAGSGVPGFLRGFGLALGLAALAQAAGLAAHAGWRLDGGTLGSYLARLVGLTALLLPPAFVEELAFRGAAIGGMARGAGRVGAIAVTAILFSLAHGNNPGVTPIGLGNIALAGVFLGLTFFTRGGLWTATGAHLGWNLALAGLAAPVSGNSFEVPWIDFEPGTPAWLTGGNFGPEGGLLATGALVLGVLVVSRWRHSEEIV